MSVDPEANGDDAARAGKYLHRILRLRVEVVVVGLLVISLGLFVLAYLAQTRQWQWANAIPLMALAATALSTGIIGLVYEWFIRRDALEQLRDTIRQLSKAERPVLAEEVARTIVVNDSILHRYISTDNAQRILLSALTAASGNAELAEGVRRGVVEGALRADDYWENYRARIFVSDSTDLIVGSNAVDSFFNFNVVIRYEMRLRKSVFRFGATASLQDLKLMLVDRGFDGSWLVAPSSPYTELDERLFSLKQISVAGVDLAVTNKRDDGRLVFTAESARLGAAIGQRVQVEYRYQFKFDKRAHIFVVNVKVPTRRATYEFDYADSSIVRVNVFDFLTPSSGARVMMGNDASRDRTAEVEATDWVFPGGGVAFGWVLREERDESFIRKIGRPRPR